MITNIQQNNAINNDVLGNEVMKIIAKQTFDVATKEVENAEFSSKKMKSLTTDIMNSVSELSNPQLMFTIAKTIGRWKQDITIEWKNSLNSYARKHENIKDVYIKQYEGKAEFLIIVDDILLDEVLDYNDFCFELLDDYPDIENFYVFDKDEFYSVNEEYIGFKKVYQRG